MTNPDNIVRVRARNGGRASVYEANGWAQAYSMGLLEGNGVTQNTSADMNVLVGGSTTKPDVVIAENPAGYKIALDLVTQQAVAITAPASNSRISAIVAYTDDLSLQSTETDITGSPASCGLIVVNGTTAATPAVPDDSQIRSAITADGATGSQASYCIIATVEVAAGTTIITDSQITNRVAKLSSSNVDSATFRTWAGTVQTANLSVSPSGNTLQTIDVSGVPNGWIIDVMVSYWWRCETRNKPLRITEKVNNYSIQGNWMRSSIQGGAEDTQATTLLESVVKTNNTTTVTIGLDCTGSSSNTVVKDGRARWIIKAYPGELTPTN